MKVTHKLLLLTIIVLGFSVRIFNISNNPPSLYWDEVSLGYNAYSILTSFIDEHGETLPIARFIAFGDYKPPGYIYLTVPSIFIFGLNEFSVRIPSVLSGVMIIYFSYLVSYELLKNRKISLITSFLVAVSPWAIQLSRGAFEANAAALMSLIGVYLFLKFNAQRQFMMPLSVIFFIFSFYTFNANRIIAPLILLILFVYKFKEVIKFPKIIILSIILSILFIIPSYSYLRSPESKIRFQEVSIFTNLKVLETSNQRIDIHDNSIISRLIYNRRIAYAREFLIHFFDHFKADYLFTNGDQNPRLSTRVVGIFYFFESIFLISGVFLLIKKKFPQSVLIGSIVIVSLIPSSLAKETPHALRTITAMPFFYMFIGFGFYSLYKFLSSRLRSITTLVFCLSYIGVLLYYFHILFINYPVEWAGEWQYGYKDAVLKSKELYNKYDYIVASEAYGRPYIYWLFYNTINPKEYLQTRIASRDWFGFWDVDGFDKFRFGSDQLAKLDGSILFIGSPSETQESAQVIDTINSLDNLPVFVFTLIHNEN